VSEGTLAAVITGILGIGAVIAAGILAYAARGKATKPEVEDSLRDSLELYWKRIEALEAKVEKQQARIDALEDEVGTWREKARASDARALAAEARSAASEARAAAADVRVITLVAEINSLKMSVGKVEQVQKEACGG
jgi:hypothetical protein